MTTPRASRKRKKPVTLGGVPLIADPKMPSYYGLVAISLDGDTQSCEACERKIDHRCGKRQLTVAESDVLRYALDWFSDRNDPEWSETHMLNMEEACRAVRAERAAGEGKR